MKASCYTKKREKTLNIRHLKKPVVIAHRGFKKKFPENTFSAFDSAIDNGALMIELDVTLTKDRKTIVIHDETLDRTTNGTGLVSDYTLKELKSLDAGSWFSDSFKNEQLPELEEIIKRYSKKTMINIEIKPEAYEDNERHDSIESQINYLIDKYNCRSSVIISSFKDKVIERLNTMPEKLFTAFLTETPADISTIDFIKKSGVFSWNTDYKVITKDMVEMMHKNSIHVFSYTVNDIKTAKNLFSMGVDGIFTDDILLFK